MAIARTTLTSSLAVQDELAIVGGQEWVVSGVGLLKGLLYQFVTGTNLDFVVGSSAAYKDFTVYMSGTSLDKAGAQNVLKVDASAKELQLKCWLWPSSVGAASAISNLPAGRLAFYRTGANSIGVAYASHTGNIQYGTLTNSVVAY